MFDLSSFAKAKPILACMVSAMSKIRECILNCGVTAFACSCPETRGNGSICYFCIRTGMFQLLEYMQYNVHDLLESSTAPRNSFQKGCSTTASTWLFGAMNTIVESSLSQSQGRTTISPNLDLRSQRHSPMVKPLKSRFKICLRLA
jgi:hypothetical protein